MLNAPVAQQPASFAQLERQIAAAWERARTAARTSPLYFGGAIVPFKSPIDKAAAYAVMSMSCADEPVWLHVCKTTNFPDEKIDEWEKKGVCCIDLGHRKYHNVTEGSATEWLVERYNLQRTAGIMKLVEVINKNNKTGYLKSFRNAVPLIMRELYELEPNDADWWSVHVLAEAAKVVAAFVRFQNGEMVRQHAHLPAPIDQLVAQFGDADRPLTLGQYVNNLWALGETPDAILEKLEFWQTGMKRLADAKRAAKERLASAKLNTFGVKFGEKVLPGVLLERCGHFFNREVLHTRRFAIRIIVEDDGHAAISTNALDCGALHKYLERREPGRWHHNVQMGSLINGGPQYIETPPTQIPARVLVQFVQEYLAPKKK